jgi:hypothetical protein
MIGRHVALDRFGLAAGVFWALWAWGGAGAQEPAAEQAAASRWISVERLPVHVRDGVRRVLEHPTLETRGPTEFFRGSPELYHWLLDHPDRGVSMWRRLGAKCMDITDRGGGRFGWTDGQGTDIHWETVYRGPQVRIWYAEGEGRPGPALGTIKVRAVAVLRYQLTTDARGRTVIKHQADLFLQTDSKAVALVAKLMGASAPQLARQCVGQMELFYSFLVAYLDRHPERTEPLLLGGLPADAAAAAELRRLLGKT